MRDDVTNWVEVVNEHERMVSYNTSHAHITVHIPKRTPEQQKEYEKNVKAALRHLYYHVTVELGLNWDKVTKSKE